MPTGSHMVTCSVTTESQFTSFIGRHRILLAKERDAEVERSSLLLSNCGPKLLERKGLALLGLGIIGVNIGLEGKTLIELERPTAHHSTPIFPPHTLRPGDLARIEEHVSSGSSKSTKNKNIDVRALKTKVVEGVVYKVSDTRIVIAVDPSEENVDIPDRCRVLKLANSVTYDRMDAALDRLEKTVIPSSNDKPPQEMTRLIQVLLGMTQPSTKIPVHNLAFFDSTLNTSQKEAVKFALEAPEVACIHGPPGTGKTHTLIEIIRQLTNVTPSNQKQKRLLVCGASNLSVDNILERLLALPPGANGEKVKVTRIGHPARVTSNEGVLDSTLDAKAGRSDQASLAKDVKNELEEILSVLTGKGKGGKNKSPRGLERKKMWEEVKALRKEYRQREGGVVNAVLAESQIVVATCHSSGGHQLRYHDFDVVLIDEATQALEAVCWIPIFKGKKLILAGDPMQLPPTILSIDMQGRKLKIKAGSFVIQASRNNSVGKTKWSKLDSKSKTAQPSSEVVEVSIEPQVSSDSDTDSETSSDGDQMLDEDEPALVMPSNSPSNIEIVDTSKTQTKTKCTGLKPPRTLETTLFDRLEMMYGLEIKRMLTVQYRMHSQICEFPSKTLYSSKLTSHESVAPHLLRDLPNAKPESEEDQEEVLSTPVVFFDTAGCEYYERLEGDGDEGSRCNENEATVVKNWIGNLVDNGVTPSQIAVITPYQAQVTLLTSLLRHVHGPQLEIGTVDGMQGREKDAVIISLVRSNETREVGFLKEKRRLNVAMTRAKRHLCIIGDSSTIQHGGTFLKKWLAWLEANADVRYAGL